MNERVAAKLREAVISQGRRLAQNRRDLERILRQDLSEFTRDVDVILAARDALVPEAILAFRAFHKLRSSISGRDLKPNQQLAQLQTEVVAQSSAPGFGVLMEALGDKYCISPRLDKLLDWLAGRLQREPGYHDIDLIEAREVARIWSVALGATRQSSWPKPAADPPMGPPPTDVRRTPGSASPRPGPAKSWQPFIFIAVVLLGALLVFWGVSVWHDKKLYLVMASSVLTGAGTFVWILTGAQLDGRKKQLARQHPFLCPIFEWVGQWQMILLPFAALCLLLGPALSGWKDLIDDPKVVINNVYYAAEDNAQRIVRVIKEHLAAVHELPPAPVTIPASTEVDVILPGGVSGTPAANATYPGQVANDVFVSGASVPVISRGAPVTVQLVPFGSALGVQLIRISRSGKTYTVSTHAGASPGSKAILQLSPPRQTAALRRGLIGGAVGAVGGVLFGRKGNKRENAGKAAVAGAKLGAATAPADSDVQVVTTIAPAQVIAFYLSQQLVMRP
jgi:hypothetical protein